MITTGSASRDPGGVHAPLWLAVGVPLVALIFLILVEASGADRSLFLWLNSLSEITGAALWRNTTILGDGLVCAVLMVPWMRRHPERVWGALIGAVVMVIVLRFFKELLSLPRPVAVLGPDAFNLLGPGYRRSSFPSGHTATIFLYAGAWILPQRRPRASLALVGLAALVGLSRVAVGLHWPTDVLAGAFVGWLAAWLGVRWVRPALGTLSQWDRLLAGILTIAAGVLLFTDYTGYIGVLWLQRTIALAGLVLGAWTVLARPSGVRPEA